jgi:UrcA family protein
MSRSIHKALIPALTFGAAALLPAAAHAEGRAWQGQDFTHAFDRHALQHEEGAAREYARLKRAVERYCAAPSGTRGLRLLQKVADCEEGVMAECERRMPKALLAQHRLATAPSRHDR